MPRERCEGRHPRLARRGLVARDREGGGGQGREGDRVRPAGRKNSPASIYVSFDGRAVGVLQGKGVVAGLKANGKYGQKPVVAELNGGETDNNSFLFKGGYDSILKPLYAKGTFKKGPDQFVPGWDNQKARTIFEQMLVSTGNKIDAVAAANDGLANAGRDGSQGEEAEADPAIRPGRDGAGRPEHHLGLADDDRVEGHADPRDAIGRGGGRPLKGQTPKRTGAVKNGTKVLLSLRYPARVDHEGELPATSSTGTLKRGARSAAGRTGSTASSMHRGSEAPPRRLRPLLRGPRPPNPHRRPSPRGEHRLEARGIYKSFGSGSRP